MSSKALTTIYIFLPDEAVDVWRPVEATHLGGDRYRIMSVNLDADTERWQFDSGDIVRCERRELSDGEELVACERIAIA